MTTQILNSSSAIAGLRLLIPTDRPSARSAVRVAEEQADGLVSYLGITTWPIPTASLETLPKVLVERRPDVPASGCCFWDGTRRTWVIHIDERETEVRQRFTIAHELKHILDHGRLDLLYGELTRTDQLAERCADVFASCLLMPRSMVTAAAASEFCEVSSMAAAFLVSPKAAADRMVALNLPARPQSRLHSLRRVDEPIHPPAAEPDRRSQSAGVLS